MEETHEPSPSKKIHKEEETALEILKHVHILTIYYIFKYIFVL